MSLSSFNFCYRNTHVRLNNSYTGHFHGKLYRILHQNVNCLISVPCPRLNCLKSIPFTAAHTYILYSLYMGLRPLPPGYTKKKPRIDVYVVFTIIVKRFVNNYLINTFSIISLPVKRRMAGKQGICLPPISRSSFFSLSKSPLDRKEIAIDD